MQPAVILFGEVLADVFPEQTVLGGAPFNVARHLQAFGLQPLLVSRTGNDSLRQNLLDSMHGYGMDSTGVQLDIDHPTGEVLVHVKGHEHSFEILANQAYDYIDVEAVQTLMVPAPRMIYFGTLAQRNAVSQGALKHLLENVDAKKFLDINLRTPWYTQEVIRYSLQHADIVKMNEEELMLLKNILGLPGQNIQAYAMNLLKQFHIETLLITAGEQGAWQASRDERIITAHAHFNNDAVMVDTVGAGDAFSAACIVGFFNNWPADLMMTRANHFAGAMCSQRGAIPRNVDFHTPFLQKWRMNIPNDSSN